MVRISAPFSEDADREARLLVALEIHADAISYIKMALWQGNVAEARAAWQSLPWDAQIDLWVSPTIDGHRPRQFAPFTTKERELIRGEKPPPRT